MSKSRWVTVSDIRLGALFRYAAAKRLEQSTVAALLVERCRLSHAAAAQLAAHWFTTEPFRKAAA